MSIVKVQPSTPIFHSSCKICGAALRSDRDMYADLDGQPYHYLCPTCARQQQPDIWAKEILG